MQAIISVGIPRLIGSSIQISWEAVGQWGSYMDAIEVDLSAASPTQLSTVIRRKVIQFASTIGLTLSPRDVWVFGIADEQDFVRTSQDRTTTLATFVDVPELNFKLAPNASYKFEFEGMFTAALATTGLQLSINGPFNPAVIRFLGMVGESVTTQRYGGASTYDVAIAGTNSAAATPLPFRVSGSITTGADVTTPLTLRARSEVAGSQVTIIRGAIGSLFSAN